VARLELALTVIWPAVLRGDDTAVANFLRLSDQLNKLMGAYRRQDEQQRVSGQLGPTPPDATPTVQWTPDASWMRAFAEAWDEIHPVGTETKSRVQGHRRACRQ
jgi:hypothetical protein